MKKDVTEFQLLHELSWGRLLAVVAAICCLDATVSTAKAQFVLPDLIAADSFDYPAGPLNGQNGGTGLLGPWTQSNSGNVVSAPGWRYMDGNAELQSTGNRVTLSGNNQGNFRNLSYVLGEHPATVYVSFIGEISSADYAGISFYYLSDEKYFMGRPTGP